MRISKWLPWKGLKTPRALPMRDLGLPIDEGAYCWEDWEADYRAQYPVGYFCRQSVPHTVRGWVARLGRVVYWFNEVTWRKQHMLDLRHQSYTHGYQDPDYIMLLACFAALVKFVKEDPEVLSKDGEVFELYYWWMNNGLDDSYEDQQTMLLRLMKIRERLWV